MGLRIGVFLLFVAFVWAMVHIARSTIGDDVSREGEKQYARDVTEGFRFRHHRLPVDSVVVRSCRIGKLRKGPLTFGGFNVLNVEGLELNLPFPKEDGRAAETNDLQSVIGGIGLSESVRKIAGLGGKRFSAVRINGMIVNRIVNGEVEPVFSAERAKNRGKTLALFGCKVVDAGVTNAVGDAVLRFRPTRLVWAKGEKDLRDLFE